MIEPLGMFIEFELPQMKNALSCAEYVSPVGTNGKAELTTVQLEPRSRDTITLVAV